MNCCRICLTNDLTNEFPSIFAEVQIFNGIYRIFDAIKEICPSILEESSVDCLPKKICWDCLKFCRNSFGFKKNCEETDKLFREILKEHNESREELPANSVLHHDNYKITECPLLPRNLVIIEEEPSTVDLIKEEIHVVEVKTEVIEEKMDVLEVKPEVIKEKIDVLEVKPEVIEEKTDVIQEKIEVVEEEIDIIEEKPKVVVEKIDVIEGFCKKIKTKLTMPLNYHQNTHRIDICIICGVQFKTWDKLYAHYKQHNSKEFNLCSVNGKKLCAPNDLESHVTKDNNEPFYQCVICLKLFAASALDELKEHSKSHQDVRSFECGICERVFKTKKKLKEHTLCHTKRKSYQCDFCENAYASRSAITNHLTSHIGKRSYDCLTCGKVFARDKLLATHKKNCHKVFKRTCIYCKKKFKSSISLLKHQKNQCEK